MSRYVLVADAENELERQTRSELEGSGVEVVATRDGSAAHDLLATRGAPLLLVADLTLPRRDGFSLLRGLRRVDTGRKVTAVVVSRFPKMLAVAHEARVELGPLIIHAKPLPAGALRRALSEVLGAAPSAAPPAMPTRPPPVAQPAPEIEKRRLARIEEMGAHDPEEKPDADLQGFIEQVANDFGVPVALASLVLADRQWFKAYRGITGRMLEERGTLRKWAFCQHVVEGASPLVVPDARHHPLFADNELVKDGIVTGYAGAPLVTPSGEVLGTLCIIDHRPLDLDADGIQKLVVAARAIAGELEVRAMQKRTPAPSLDPTIAARALPYADATLQGLECGVILLRSDRRAILANRAVTDMFGVEARSLLGKTRDEIVAAFAPAFKRPREDSAKLHVAAAGPWVIRVDLELVDRTVRWVGRPVPLPDGIGQLISVTDITRS